MKPEDYLRRDAELAGWPVRIISYRLGDRFLCTVDNLDPGANIARAAADSRQAAEQAAIDRATERLARTRRG